MVPVAKNNVKTKARGLYSRAADICEGKGGKKENAGGMSINSEGAETTSCF